MELIAFLIGTIVVPLVLGIALKLSPDKTLIKLANLLAKYIGTSSANEVTNIAAFFLTTTAYSMLVSIPDDEELQKISNDLFEVKERMKKKISKDCHSSIR